ncbi:hypothetical protein K788_0001894 (plasmid) [Paraburkholderia caribensis MBA4]|uniref:Uncharacterized protein n=1 Tax=Paraburkholderia caribensis MBA4 TaxID=1323664 RepID=A0A0P0RQJ3_9BURK|nr:hypothetical protein [Paraburkholderia caribensis]ALL71291.1 hypothetical protein K788_0001894 [Paraburkholderia caribensis MBA4]
MIDRIRLGDTTNHAGEAITASHTKRYNGRHFECDNAPERRISRDADVRARSLAAYVFCAAAKRKNAARNERHFS